jgi:hypothetical protein
MWVEVEFWYHAFNVVFTYSYFKSVERNRRESLWLLGFNVLLNLLHTGWLIYGNILYYKYSEQCFDQFNKQESLDGMNLEWVMLIFVIVGYVTMFKCCIISSAMLCLGPLIIRQIRRARRPDANWIPTQTELLNRLVKGKVKPEDIDAGKECIICMIEYQPEDEVVQLPCDERHFFHADCITTWLRSNNSCPLCKKPITEQDLRNQRRQTRQSLRE